MNFYTYGKHLVFFELFFSLYLIDASEPSTVKLLPPRLDDASIVVKASCNRPRRPDGINISVQKTDTQEIVHCYGHGGYGFTTLFGSIEEAINLFLATNPPFDSPIRIIGSGCMGLTMAIELHRRGFKTIKISTKERYNIPSWRAGGFFDPGTGTETRPQDIYRVRLAMATYEVLQGIEKGTHTYLKQNILKKTHVKKQHLI